MNATFSQMVTSAGITRGSLPIRYLGLPLTTKSMTKSDYEPLIDRIRNRFLSWTSKFLSYGGRLQLIQSVIASITNFWSSVFKLPKRCFELIESMCASFLWSGSVVSTYRAKVAWDVVCLPKKEGGLGLRRMTDTSKVFMLNLIWRLHSSSSLWVAWTRHYLLRYSSFWDVKLGVRGSWIWRKLLQLRPLAQTFFRIQIGNGRTTRFWSDPWLPPSRLLDEFGGFTRQLGIPRSCMVAEVCRSTGWHFRRVRDRNLQRLIDRVRLHPVPTDDAGPDIALWRSGPDDYRSSFSTTHTWELLRSVATQVPWSRIVWFPFSVPRFAFITWLAILDRLDTGSRATVWGGGSPCPLCGDPVETRDHLFFACSFSFVVWLQVGGKILGRTASPDWTYTLTAMCNNRKSKQDNVLLRIAFQSTIYHIWRERNDRNHGGRHNTPTTLSHRIHRSIRDRVLSKKQLPAPELETILCRWDIHFGYL